MEIILYAAAGIIKALALAGGLIALAAIIGKIAEKFSRYK